MRWEYFFANFSIFFPLYKTLKIVLKWPKEMMNKTLVKDRTSEFQEYWLFLVLQSMFSSIDIQTKLK